MMATVWLVVCTALLASPRGATAAEREGAVRSTDLIRGRHVLVIAHRGDSAIAPENTLPAFASAVEAGSDLIELDYHHSADGEMIVIHDATLDRTTDAVQRWGTRRIDVGAESLARIRELDAGRWFRDRFAGTPVPTLDEALDVIQDGSMTLIERKAGDAVTCVELLRRRGLLEEVVVQAFDWKYLADCRRLAPELTLAALGGKDLTAERLDEIEALGVQIVAWRHTDLDREGIAAIHDRGLAAWTWTVDDLSRAEQLLDEGINGIITNVPAKVRAIVADRGLARRGALSAPEPAGSGGR